MTVAAAAALLAGCAPGPGWAILDRAATPVDYPPASLPDYARSSMYLETARYAGEHKGASLWLAREREAPSVCLLVHVDDTDWATSCGEAAGPGTISG